MESVTGRIKQYKQPYGGFIPPKAFTCVQLNDGEVLHACENIAPCLTGTAVDYLTRLAMGRTPKDAFCVSLLGASLIGQSRYANILLRDVVGLDDTSIINACKLVGYDVCYRAGSFAYKPVEDINPDNDTISNIRVMVNRCIKFLDVYGPIVRDGFTFEGGYTETISTGDGDYLTKHTLWDFKVSKAAATNKQTLQLLVYYIMGKHSIREVFQNILRLGVFNPRLNQVSTLDVSGIDKDIIAEVSRCVIVYK